MLNLQPVRTTLAKLWGRSLYSKELQQLTVKTKMSIKIVATEKRQLMLIEAEAHHTPKSL